MSNWSPSQDWPYPPANVMAMSAFTGTDVDVRWDDPANLNTGPATPSTRAAVTITVVGTPITLQFAVASLTVITAPIAAGVTIIIGGETLTSVVGPVLAANQFDGSSLDRAVLAANITTAINAGSIGTWGIATAISIGPVVKLTSGQAGIEGNKITVSTSSVESLAITTFAGGRDPDVLIIGGQVLTAVPTRTLGGMNFGVGPTNFNTAASIAAAVNDRGNTLGFVSARIQDGDQVVLSAFREGTMGNGVPVSTDSAGLALSDNQTQGGSGVACQGKSNSVWTIVGVNVYRSDTGERGPYNRVNKIPLGSLFFRDKTDIVAVENEIISWDGSWIYRGDAPNDPIWRFRTRYRQLVKTTGNAVPASSPNDVEVFINGFRMPLAQVFGPTGEIDLNLSPVWDPSIENFSTPPTPTANSIVTVSYSYGRGNVLTMGMDQRVRVFYRLTTVALDPTGNSPSGLVETPLEHSEPVTPFNSETLDYIWVEAIRRNRFILEQGGERVKLYVRKITGVPCNCVWDSRLREYTGQPLNACVNCFGVGWLGGYEGPTDIIVGPDESDRRVTQTPNGRRLESTYEVWIGPSPMVSQRDFIVKQNGERYSIGPVRRSQIRGLTLQQAFQIGYLPESDVRYQIPMTGLERLAWPETRYTRPEDSPCEEAPPYPVGYDYQASPMATEVAKVPNGREIRGRTPVFANLLYGGGGGGGGS